VIINVFHFFHVFFAGVTNCQNFRDTADMIAKVAFKMFLGVTADIASWNTEGTSFSLILSENPLTEFVELPPLYQNLLYSNVLCGVIKGALEMVQLQVRSMLAIPSSYSANISALG
jgi:hypothetical protein